MFPIGHILHDTYRIERMIGQGGMAWVFEVAHVRLPRRFALKVITAPAAKSSEFMLRFRREAEILASLDHPNLVNVVDWNITPSGQPYLVMELLSGEDLAQLMQRSGSLPQRVALSIFAQAVAALEVAHSHGITHRDLKPANIFLCKNGLVPHFTKVLDFGIAKSAQHASALVTDHLVLMGTPAYMAPEQARGDVAGVDARADQFSLALVLYEMLCGRAAFYQRGEPPMTTLCRVMLEEPPPLPDPAMNQALMRALRKQPEERYRSLSDMVAAVMAAASVPPESIEVPERTERTNCTDRTSRVSARPTSSTKERQSRASSPPPRIPRQVPRLNLEDERAAPSSSTQLAPVQVSKDASVPRAMALAARSSNLHRIGQSMRWRYALPLLCGCFGFGVFLAIFFGVPGQDDRPVRANPPAPIEVPAPTPDLPDLMIPPVDIAPPVAPDLSVPAPPPPPPPVVRRTEIRLSGVSPRGEAGSIILKCTREAFDPLRHFSDQTVEVQRIANRFIVANRRLPAERCSQLAQCLNDRSTELRAVPSNFEIKIAELRSP